MILDWVTNGDLPPGVHFATWRGIGNGLGFWDFSRGRAAQKQR